MHVKKPTLAARGATPLARIAHIGQNSAHWPGQGKSGLNRFRMNTTTVDRHRKSKGQQEDATSHHRSFLRRQLEWLVVSGTSYEIARIFVLYSYGHTVQFRVFG